MDRTLIPNGYEPDDGGLPIFAKLVEERNFVLAYASGRNWQLFEETLKEYPLPVPDYFFGDVGTVLYKKDGEGMKEDAEWTLYIKENTPRWNWENLQKLTEHAKVRLQEDWRQNPYKLSYYVDELEAGKDVTQELRKRLEDADIHADVIYSVDPLKNVGLLDVLPAVATKVTAVEFLRKRLGAQKDEVVYCGDSGNDLLPLTYGYKSVLVGNASDDIKDEVESRHAQNGTTENLYIASGRGSLNGNFASGVLEGLVHFGVFSEDALKK